jgi:hypothetical protein
VCSWLLSPTVSTLKSLMPARTWYRLCRQWGDAKGAGLPAEPPANGRGQGVGGEKHTAGSVRNTRRQTQTCTLIHSRRCTHIQFVHARARTHTRTHRELQPPRTLPGLGPVCTHDLPSKPVQQQRGHAAVRSRAHHAVQKPHPAHAVGQQSGVNKTWLGDHMLANAGEQAAVANDSLQGGTLPRLTTPPPTHLAASWKVLR